MSKTYKKNGGKFRVKQNGDEISDKERNALEAKKNARSKVYEDEDVRPDNRSERRERERHDYGVRW